MSDSNHAANTESSPNSNVKVTSEKRAPSLNGNKGVDEFGLPLQPDIKGISTNVNESDEDDDTFHDVEDKAGAPKGISRTENVHITEEISGETAMKEDARRKITSSTVAEDSTSERCLHAKSGTDMIAEHSSGEVNEELNSSSRHEGLQKEIIPSKVDNNTHQRTASVNSLSNTIVKKEKRQSDGPAVSEWSHQQLAPQKEVVEEEEEEEWQAMPAIDEFDVFDDDGRLVAKGLKQQDEEIASPYLQMAGAGKGYTRVLDDEDAQSATSMDEDTNYLFKKPNTDAQAEFDDEDQRDAMTQLETTKDLLTEGQRIAYVGMTRLTIFRMVKALEDIEPTRSTRKEIAKSYESIGMWGQQIMVRLYKHMDIDATEQIMIEQLAQHGLEANDLVPPLMINAKVDNPMADEKTLAETASSTRTSLSETSTAVNSTIKDTKDDTDVPEVHGYEDMPVTKQIDLDLRWTVLCDLFLLLVAEGVYDARSRRLLERVGSSLKITWIQICRFEKRVMDQLEMDEAGKENWDESEHMEERRKKGLKRKYVVMGLATVGGGLVIGLSAGLMAPLIGAGLAAGFTTIGVGGTAGFLGGVGGAALITSAATAAGGSIAVRASHRRTGHVSTFEYRPLHNNKRLNLILSVSGWMTGKVDDVRQPFSTVDPIMGDIYSLLWEPEMLQSMGDTINILATEALTQTVQQVLGSTILVALMASLQLPVVLTKLAYLIDNPWTVSLDRANAAGLILADSLIARHLGQRPITLLGFSLGSRLIFSCLKELAARGAYGIIQNVYLFGSPIVAKRDEWLRARSVIAGRFVNGYATNDWILGYLFRATSGGIMRVAGLAPVENIPGLENLDVTDIVNGHMAYRTAMPKLLKKVGWEVESEEFNEIEDPDPENHQKRQRELIKEIDEARRMAEQKPEKKRFGLFKFGKLAEKKGWETYDANVQKKSPKIGTDPNGPQDLNSHILFDIDAIRKELISEQIEIRELEGNQPPMQFTTVTNGQKHTEFLRLPPEIKPEEVAKMKLPPRPDELDDGPLPPMMRNGISRAASTPPTQTPARRDSHEIVFEQPKELKSTLPPLTLRLNSQSTEEVDNGLSTRPALKKHDTEPVGLGLTKNIGTPVLGNYTTPELEDNAWADDAFSHERGSVRMTFE